MEPSSSQPYFPPPRTSPAVTLVALPPVDDDAPEGMRVVGPVQERKARDWALVLQSMGVYHVRRTTARGWVLWVREEEHARALASIQRYELENRDWPPRPAREKLRFPLSPIAPIAFLALIAFFAVTGPVSGGASWFARGSSVADLVVSTEPWRAVTALTLHADSSHVLGNAISGTIFASIVNRRLGPGGGTLAVVASGIAGNAANALYHHVTGSGGHGSIGASTAVFGAIGVLAATQLIVDRSSHAKGRGWLAVLAPIAGGLALLGSLGASPTSDLGAHLFGFLAGVVIGVLAAFAFRLRAEHTGGDQPIATRWWAQTAFGAIALGVLLGSWQLALRA